MRSIPFFPTLIALSLGLAAAQVQAVELDIPAQSLDSALTDFAEQAGIRLLYDANLTRGVGGSSTLKGDYSVSEGLQQLLQGSGLTFSVGADGTVTLIPRHDSSDVLELGATTVSGQLDGRRDLPSTYAGGQVARGGRMGVLGNQDMQDTPFAFSSYTSELIEARQAQTLADVLASDPGVRQSFGFGNFSQVFVVRGFQLYSDDIAFNGLYGMLPRQIISTEAVERVEVFKGANAFLNGVAPSGSGVGGAINVVSKRAEDIPTRRFTMDYANQSRIGGHLDIGQRFGEDNRFGVRVNLAQREGETAIEREQTRFHLATVNLDYRGDRLRLAADLGYQKQRVNEGRSVVHLSTTVTGNTLGGKVPRAPDSKYNSAQPWSWSQLEDTYGMFSAEYDLSSSWTAYLIAGSKYTRENGLYSSHNVYGANGESRIGRLYSPLDQESSSVTSGLRGQFMSGPISHQFNLAASGIWQEKRNAYESTRAADRGYGNLYDDTSSPQPIVSRTYGDMHDPRTTAKVQNKSLALSDTLGFVDDRVLLTVGLRRQSIVADSWAADTGARAPGYDKSITTPAYGLVIKPTEYLSLYANRVESLQQGPTAPAAARNNGVMLAPYRSKQTEVGAKLDWGRFGGNLSLFRIEQPQGVTGGDGYFSMDGEQRNQGVELSLFGELLPGLRLLGGVTWTDTELSGTAKGENDGNRAVGVPEFQFNVGADWDVPGVPGLSLNGLLLRTGGQYVEVANEYSIPAWTRVDLGARYKTRLDGRVVTFNALVENVADENYWASANGGYLTQGNPRTLKLSATVDF